MAGAPMALEATAAAAAAAVALLLLLPAALLLLLLLPMSSPYCVRQRTFFFQAIRTVG